ncbi:MAG TPA: pentapeptide repeat-containing protein [Kofleriaceae bacterium]
MSTEPGQLQITRERLARALEQLERMPRIEVASAMERLDTVRAVGFARALVNAAGHVRADFDTERYDAWLTQAAAAPASAQLVNGPDLYGMQVAAGDIELFGLKCDGLDIQRCYFDEHRLEQASFEGATLRHCSFRRALLRGSVWRRSIVEQTAFVGSDLKGAILDGALFVDCDLSGAVLDAVTPAGDTLVRFVRCDLRGASWLERTVDGIEFSDCQKGTVDREQ